MLRRAATLSLALKEGLYLSKIGYTDFENKLIKNSKGKKMIFTFRSTQFSSSYIYHAYRFINSII